MNFGELWCILTELWFCRRSGADLMIGLLHFINLCTIVLSWFGSVLMVLWFLNDVKESWRTLILMWSEKNPTSGLTTVCKPLNHWFDGLSLWRGLKIPIGSLFKPLDHRFGSVAALWDWCLTLAALWGWCLILAVPWDWWYVERIFAKTLTRTTLRVGGFCIFE